MPNMELIQAVTVGAGGAANIEFSSIPQTYTDLQIILSGRDSGNGDWFSLNFNNSSSNFNGRQIFANGSGVYSYTKTDANEQAVNNNNSTTANIFGNTSIYIFNYKSSNNKSYSINSITENNATLAYEVFFAGLWSNSAAINNIKIIPSGSGFAQYSTAYLYGVTSAGYGAKATGGIITSDENYYYHTFISSGTFTPTQSITADYLVVAGGGGGGANEGGGGGAGGLRSTVTATGGGGSLESALSLTSNTAYTVTVGAGGAGRANSGRGTNGSNSVFSTITSTGGGAGGGEQTSEWDGNPGGSGGGGNGTKSNPAASGGAASPSGQGYAGGAGSNSTGTQYAGGGGGGASAIGSEGTGSAGGNGGAGVAVSITGSSVTYAGGGGGGARYSNAGSGGSGGGGAGKAGEGTATSGTVNTGGGGGGAGNDWGINQAGTGGTGGSGIVIVRYAK